MSAWTDNQVSHEAVKTSVQQCLAHVDFHQCGFAAWQRPATTPQRSTEVTSRQRHHRAGQCASVRPLSEDLWQQVGKLTIGRGSKDVVGDRADRSPVFTTNHSHQSGEFRLPSASTRPEDMAITPRSMPS